MTDPDGDRWVMAGDMATVEADGTIVVLGRGSLCINSGGEKIYPEEVELALRSHPDVFDAVVVGVPDERWGERVAAVVQPQPGATPTLDELSAHCATRIARYKVPRELHLVDEMQRSPSGKADYRWAKAVALGGKQVSRAFSKHAIAGTFAIATLSVCVQTCDDDDDAPAETGRRSESRTTSFRPPLTTMPKPCTQRGICTAQPDVERFEDMLTRPHARSHRLQRRRRR